MKRKYFNGKPVKTSGELIAGRVMTLTEYLSICARNTVATIAIDLDGVLTGEIKVNLRNEKQRLYIVRRYGQYLVDFAYMSYSGFTIRIAQYLEN